MVIRDLNAIAAAAKEMLDDLLALGFTADCLDANGWEFEDWHNENDVPGYIGMSSGATRFVFWNENHKDYVYKIQYYDNEDVDYGRTEQETYEEAKSRNLDEHFAWCAKLFDCEISGETFGVYAMEYVDIFCEHERTSKRYWRYCFNRWCDRNDFAPDESNEKTVAQFKKETWVDYCPDQEDMLEFAESEWGENDATRVINLLNDFGINDCHGGNWGYTKQNKLVLCDYAGYEVQGGLAYAERKAG